MSKRRPSPYLPLVYPLILVLGSFYSIISPAAFPPPATPLAAGLASDLNAPPSNYFSGKKNVFNLYFVKIGWFWTTLAFTLLQFTTRPPPANTQKHYMQATLRYVLITLSWYLTTQWFFGPALIDRSFTITGGQCEPQFYNEAGLQETLDLKFISSGPACKVAGGTWRGGYDISGHVFMLVLSSAFLLYELYIADRHSSHPSVSPQAAARLAHDLTEEERNAVGGWEPEWIARVRVWSRYLLYLVVILDLWMLMMTAIWFHTWLEKASGLVLAGFTVWGTYFLGDLAEGWKAIVGGL
ncbi:uncharacterized protein A1O9_06553 [Exophiala aquamarina CBS 119918]|uniref:Inositol phospholipid biosynthesis protein Scs3 n=1 Tax=Exophiala aquamarina CBS 119918 TaxID=1182545 RepID=A0A072PFT7_9EURO|nr:uncharacterized protein A1O9_06553 [Exophiala aquamarina CBS 119918]KEF58627.1 hypothetical protein A1O9_06553 [Exophiala aquamarina CBS 119918]